MKIVKIETGTVNDDFVHSRITAKAYTDESENCYLLKIYISKKQIGKIVTFTDQRDIGGEYVEKELSGDLKTAITKQLKAIS